jgi:hypothetical protein
VLFALRAIGRIKSGALAQVNAGGLDRVLSFAAACVSFTGCRAGTDPLAPPPMSARHCLAVLWIGTNQARVPRSSLLISVKGRSWREADVEVRSRVSST